MYFGGLGFVFCCVSVLGLAANNGVATIKLIEDFCECSPLSPSCSTAEWRNGRGLFGFRGPLRALEVSDLLRN